MSTKSDILKKGMLLALEKSMGIVTAAAKKVKINRSTHYGWMEEDPIYKEAVESLQDIALDFAESKLMASIQNGSDTAIIFFLKTKGKKRGYIERSELVIPGETVIKIIRDKDL